MTDRRNDSHPTRAGRGRIVVALLVCLNLTSPTSRAETTWEQYAALPTPENAALVDSISYSNSDLRREWDEFDLALLEVQVISCDLQAVRLAFRVMQFSDGHCSEMLSVMLGRLIRISPTLFLEVIREYWDTVVRLDALLGNTGEAYVDKMEAECYELRMRVESLSGVGDDGLLEVKEACIAELEKQTGEYCSN